MTDSGLAIPSNSRCNNLLYPEHPKIVLTEAPEITVLEEQYTIRHVFVLLQTQLPDCYRKNDHRTVQPLSLSKLHTPSAHPFESVVPWEHFTL